MNALNLPGKKKEVAPAVPAPLSRLEKRRDELRTRFSELQWDLGGAAYEMAARDYFRLDVLASMAAKLQVVDAELAEIERMARLQRAGAAGSCPGCGSLYARGAVYCWRCGRNLNEGRSTVVGPAITAPNAPNGSAPQPEPFIDPVMNDQPVPEPAVPQDPEPILDQEPEPAFAPDPGPAVPQGRQPVIPPDPGPVVNHEPEPVMDPPPFEETVLTGDVEPDIDLDHESGRPGRPDGYRPEPRSFQA